MSIKHLIIIILLFASPSNINAQGTEKATDIPLTMAIRNIAPVLDKKIPEQVKVVGIGNVTPFAKESTDLNMAIAAYLISQKKFRHIVLFDDDWLLRPVNEYLTNKKSFDSTKIDSLVRISMANSASRTASFCSFIAWLKKYNLVHPEASVDLSGIVPDEIIPPAYFLARYIFPVDKTNARILSKKWGDNIHDMESPFNDIATWYQQISKNVILFNKHKELLVRCAEDIDHNNIIRQGISLEKDATVVFNLKGRSMLQQVLKKLGKRTIIYANNEDISKSGYLIKDVNFKSIGWLLHEQLKDKYYSFLTDFADSSSLNLMDLQAGKLTLMTVPGTMQTQDLARKKSIFFLQEDRAAIKRYQPRAIFPIIGEERAIIPVSDVPPTDALFIIKHLTSSNFLKRINDIGDWVK